MSFLFDKPLIVRILEAILALAGVFTLYVAIINTSDMAFALVTGVIGVVCIVCGTLIHLRKWYAWHFTLAFLACAAAYLVISFAETMDMMWLMLLFLDVLIMFSWVVRFTRQYFDATA